MDRQSNIWQNPDSAHICCSFVQEAYSLPDLQATGEQLLIHVHGVHVGSQQWSPLAL